MTPEQELLDTIEEIRRKRFPDIPAELVEEIVCIERDFVDNRQEAYRRIAERLDVFFQPAADAANLRG